MTSARRQLQLALDQQATAQVQVDWAVEDWRKARETGDEQKVEKAKEEVKEAEQKVEKAEQKVKEAEAKVEKAEEKVKAQQEKAIRCTASVLSRFSRKMHKKMKATSHIFTFYGSKSSVSSVNPQYASKR